VRWVAQFRRPSWALAAIDGGRAPLHKVFMQHPAAPSTMLTSWVRSVSASSYVRVVVAAEGSLPRQAPFCQQFGSPTLDSWQRSTMQRAIRRLHRHLRRLLPRRQRPHRRRLLLRRRRLLRLPPHRRRLLRPPPRRRRLLHRPPHRRLEVVCTKRIVISAHGAQTRRLRPGASNRARLVHAQRPNAGRPDSGRRVQ